MPIEYSIIELFTDEEARYRGRPLYKAIVYLIRELKIVARCVVSKGIEAYYENGELATQDILVISYNMPVKIEILLPTSELETVLHALDEMIDSGICAVRKVDIYTHKIRKRIIPKHIRVRDMMTVNPITVPTSCPLDRLIQQLLSSIFTGIPVIDNDQRPVGIITQSDLIYKVKLPIKLSILPEKERGKLDNFLLKLPPQIAKDIMTQPAITINQDKMLMDAVTMMVKNNVKRLPVIDEDGKIVGVLARMDIFGAITQEFPDWNAFKDRKIALSHLDRVSHVMRKDTPTVSPQTSVEEVMNMININDLEAVAVITDRGQLQGLIFEHDLLNIFVSYEISIWNYLRYKLSAKKAEPRFTDFLKKIRKKTAAEVMKKDLITILEEAGIDEAIALITYRKIKRLPVIDKDGMFKGLINRESLLRAAIRHES
jgi:CBS-domain-containing membrane protein